MVSPVLIIVGAIPVIFAILIVIPMLNPSDIPIGAVDSSDVLSIEYSKQQMLKVSFGVTERIGAERTELLSIESDGDLRYSVTESGYPQPDKRSKIDEDQLRKLTALIKETGFMEIPIESFPIKEDITEFNKFGIKVTLNGKTRHIQWPDQDATDKFIPPIISAIQNELEGIINQTIIK